MKGIRKELFNCRQIGASVSIKFNSDDRDLSYPGEAFCRGGSKAEKTLPHLVSELDDDWSWQISEDGDREGSIEMKGAENVVGWPRGTRRNDVQGARGREIRP